MRREIPTPLTPHIAFPRPVSLSDAPYCAVVLTSCKQATYAVDEFAPACPPYSAAFERIAPYFSVLADSQYALLPNQTLLKVHEAGAATNWCRSDDPGRGLMSLNS